MGGILGKDGSDDVNDRLDDEDHGDKDPQHRRAAEGVAQDDDGAGDGQNRAQGRPDPFLHLQTDLVHRPLDLCDAGDQRPDAVENGQDREGGDEPAAFQDAEKAGQDLDAAPGQALFCRCQLRCRPEVLHDAGDAQDQENDPEEDDDAGGEAYRFHQQKDAHDGLA